MVAWNDFVGTGEEGRVRDGRKSDGRQGAEEQEFIHYECFGMSDAKLLVNECDMSRGSEGKSDES